MSLFGATKTAISGLGAQFAASGNISEDGAGSQTISAGSQVTGSLERLNVDSATVFCNSIVTRQVYSSNAKPVTAAGRTLQPTLSMVT
jgi:flagellar hook protein FlgE